MYIAKLPGTYYIGACIAKNLGTYHNIGVYIAKNPGTYCVGNWAAREGPPLQNLARRSLPSRGNPWPRGNGGSMRDIAVIR